MMGRCQNYGHWQNGMKMNSDEGQEVFVARRLHHDYPSANCRELKMTTTESTRARREGREIGNRMTKDDNESLFGSFISESIVSMLFANLSFSSTSKTTMTRLSDDCVHHSPPSSIIGFYFGSFILLFHFYC